MQAKLHTIIDALPNLLLLSVARTDFNLLPLSIEYREERSFNDDFAAFWNNMGYLVPS